MAGVRIRTEFYTDQSNRFRVDIYDASYGGSVLTGFSDAGFELEYDRTSKLLEPLMTSTCFFWLYDDGSSNFNSFKTDLATAVENRFKLVVYKYDGATPVIFWAGVIMTDMVEWNNENAPRVFEIVAKDGLNRLEKIPFDKITSAPYSTTKVGSFKQVIFDCLSYAGTAQFWNGSTKAYINCDLNWKDTQQTAITQQQILERIHFGLEFLIEDPAYNEDYTMVYLRPEDDKPLMAKEVLESVLKLFCVRLILSDGTWRVQQLSLMSNTSVSVGEYDYTGTYATSDTDTLKINTHATTLPVLAGGKFGYYPAIKAAKAQVFPSALVKGEFSFARTIHLNSTSATKTYQLGTLYGGTDLQLQINLIYVIASWSYRAGRDYYIECKFKISAGSYRIKNARTANIPQRGGDATWTTTAADVYYKDLYYAVSRTGKKENIADLISIRTEDVPFTSETGCTLELTVTLKSVSGTTTFPSYNDLQINFERVEIALMDIAEDPPIYAQLTELEVESPYTAENSMEINYGKLRITDNYSRTTQTSLNTIMVTAPNDGSSLVACNNWNAGHTTNQDIVTTMLVETIALQKLPIKKYMGDFRGFTYNAYNTIGYDSYVWVFMGGRYTATSDQWSGDWFAISYDASVTTTKNEKKYAMIGRDVKQGNNEKEYSPLDAYPVGGVPMNTIDTLIEEGDTVTSLSIETSEYAHIKSGDTISVLNPNTLEMVQEFDVTADVDVGDTSVSVTSDTADIDMWQTFVLGFNPREKVVSEILRAIQEVQSYGSYYLNKGNNQSRQVILFVDTPDAAATELTTDGATPSAATNRIAVPDDTAVQCMLYLTAKKQNTSDSLAYTRKFLIVNDSGSTTIEGSVETIGTDIEAIVLAGCTLTITANNTDDCIKVEVAGLAAQNIRWTAKLDLTYTTYA